VWKPTDGPGGHGGIKQAHRAASQADCVISGPALPGWLVITLGALVLLLAIAGPILVAIWLLRRARDADPAPGPHVTQPMASP
jgi:hypothetical protein